MGVGFPSPYVHTAAQKWCYPTDRVCVALMAFPVAQGVPPAIPSHMLDGVVGRMNSAGKPGMLFFPLSMGVEWLSN